MNEIIFRTKRDINGNTYYLIINLASKTAKSGYNMGFGLYSEGIETTKKGLRALREKFEKNGYTIEYI